MNEQLTLTERLVAASDCWATSQDATLARLGKAVVNDTAFFTNLARMRRGPSTDTLEKFARFLADPANWPDGSVADEAKALAHVTGVIAPAAALSAGKTNGVSRQGDAGAERAA